jgi:hypothetical protein
MHYGSIDRSLCERIRWDRLASNLRFAFDDLEFTGESSAYLSDAFCRFRVDESSGLENTSGRAWTFVSRDPERAYASYQGAMASAEEERSSRWPTVIEGIDGWWDGGAYLEQYREAGYFKPLLDVQYHIYHANLYIWVWFRGQVADDDLEQADALAIGHDLAAALIEEAIRLVPCEALGGAPPPTHCDAQE